MSQLVVRLLRRVPPWDVLPLDLLDLQVDLLLGLLLLVLDLLLALRTRLTARVPAMVVIQDTTVPLQEATASRRIPVVPPVVLPVVLLAVLLAVLLGLSKATHLRHTDTVLLLPTLDTVLHSLHTEVRLLSLGTDGLLQDRLDIPRVAHTDRDRLLLRGIKDE